MGNEALEIIRTRRSVRKFLDKKLPKEILEKIADAGRYAPSALNRQPVSLFVVQSPESKKLLADAIASETGRPGYCFYNADTVILTVTPDSDDFKIENCAVAMENMLLAAASLGVGSVWLNQFRYSCDKPKIRTALRKIGVSDGCSVWGTAGLGYCESPLGDAEKSDNTVFVL